MKISVFYVGSSLLAPLKKAEQEINRANGLDLTVAAYNFGSPFTESEWAEIQRDVQSSSIVFVIHIMDGENASRLIELLDNHAAVHDAVIVINCMPELMRHTRLGRLDVQVLTGNGGNGLLSSVGSWVGKQATRRSKSKAKQRDHSYYLRVIDRLPRLLRFVPTAGPLTDAKNYLYLFSYFLQPTPTNIQSMLLFALKHYAKDLTVKRSQLQVPKPESTPSVAIYHPSAPSLFETFESYRDWYEREYTSQLTLDADATIGLLLMRPQVVSKTTKHYDALISEIEAEGLAVIPAIATLMDNREAVSRFFVTTEGTDSRMRSRVSQIVSLTGFSFVGGPAMNDSAAAAEFLKDLNVPYRSAVSLDTQTIEAWQDSQTGLNPVQAGMQIAIPEIDGATEPFVYGGIAAGGREPLPLDGRCSRYAKRLRRWNHLRTAKRDQIKLAITVFCFPPTKGNIGTAADLDVFPSIWDVLRKLSNDGYRVEVPESADALRRMLLEGNSHKFGASANIAYRMTVREYRRLCPFVSEIEKEWGKAPGSINALGGELLIQGLQLGNAFLGVQPTFGFEGDPMRLMMSRGSSPHHGFMAFYTYLARVLDLDGVIHFGTHGSLEFMPGKQIGLSDECWPDRLIGELPNFYIYSVNNPSEGSIAKRRSYAELISYLTPPIENAGLYKDFLTLKELLNSYRQSTDDLERGRLFETIEGLSASLNLSTQNTNGNHPQISPITPILSSGN
ncbi:MAG TPA: cobaltochelatase subunit CobN [Pyrinomonadaceae bacterium]|nr:cobaltochelatase subunit CobN [Pyrinomonadaceae bacterium]